MSFKSSGIQNVNVKFQVPNNEIIANLRGWCKSIKIEGTKIPYRLRIGGTLCKAKSDSEGVLYIRDIVNEALEDAKVLTGKTFQTLKETLGTPEIFKLSNYKHVFICSMNPPREFPVEALSECFNLSRACGATLVFDEPLSHSNFKVTAERYNVFYGDRSPVYSY